LTKKNKNIFLIKWARGLIRLTQQLVMG